MNNAKQPISSILGKDGLPLLKGDYLEDYLQERISGLTKREHFAGLAMQGLIANAPNGHLSNSKEGVTLAIQWSDELLKQLDK